MYRLGDPSMCPPNRFRRLVNVRLGEKDVVARPGLTTVWSGASAPVIGMSEIFKKSGGAQIWHGPFEDYTDIAGAFATLVPLYTSLLIDAVWPMATPLADGAALNHVVQNMKAEASLTTAESFQTQTYMRFLSPVSYLPWMFQAHPGPGTGKTVAQYSRLFRGGITNSPSPALSANGHSHRREHELAFSTVVPALNYVAEFPDEEQWGNCLDPLVIFQGEWIAVGSIISRLHNPGVLAGKAAASAGTGQQVFKVLFSPIPLEAPTEWRVAPYTPQNDDNFLGGSLLELFRMPGVTHDTIEATASRASGGLDGETIRSMCVRSVRNDHPITAAAATTEKLYVGTHGGYPLAAGAWITPDVEYRPPIHNLADGKVYSWDGQTRTLERSSLGPGVVVITLPDQSVLACGRSAAALFDNSDQTWKAVAYSPVAKTLPRFLTGALDPPAPDAWLVEAVADADWLSTGFIWLNRILFKGEAYFIGYDSARAAQAGSSAFPLQYGGDGVYVNPPYRYLHAKEAWGLYRFNRATLTMLRVRSGADIWTAMQPTLAPFFPGDPSFANADPNILPAPGAAASTQEIFQPNLSCSLASDGAKLYYSWALTNLGVFGGGSGLDPQIEVENNSNVVAIGSYDGSTFDDDGVALRAGGVSTEPWQNGIKDMLWAPRGLWLRSVDIATDDALSLWDGSAISVVAQAIWDYQYGRLFAGPK
jgi:hypothetical protein